VNEQGTPRSERLLASFGLHPVAHRPPLNWRLWIYAITAYLLPVAVHVVFPSEAGTLDEVVWLVTLVPAFLLSLHFGLRGAFAALLVGVALLIGVQLFQVFVHTPGDPRITVPIFIAYGTLAISVGWLSEQLHAHYEYALQVQAERKTEVLGTMAAGIAHDFSNILTVMVANAEIIAGRDEGAQNGEMEQLRSAAQRGAGMVRNLLGFSRRGVLSLRHVDLSRTLGEQEPLIRRLLPGSVDLRVETGPDLPPILADREALERILVSLVTNARDAMPAGGALDIAVTIRRLEREHQRRRGWGDPGDYVCLEMTDTGHGMNEETLERIFEPFFTAREEGEAVGLGMAMVYGVMKQHRGFVDVESAPGAGTTVRLFFPVAKDRVVHSATPASPGRPQGGGETILLVEDDEPIRMAARRILERFGYTVLEAADGFEGEEVYRMHAGKIDLVLADVMLPKRTGPELYDVIRTGPSQPRVLFMSGYPAHTVRTSAGLDPTLPFIQKPWTVDDFARAVRSTLDADAAVVGPGD
jgi:two-component system, cell cycle sensor histidine kinase and response regulator CckA